jgi:hypothetical protein
MQQQQQISAATAIPTYRSVFEEDAAAVVEGGVVAGAFVVVAGVGGVGALGVGAGVGVGGGVGPEAGVGLGVGGGVGGVGPATVVGLGVGAAVSASVSTHCNVMLLLTVIGTPREN